MGGFALSVDGCPYFFTTGGVATLPTPASGFSSDWSTAWTVAPGILDWSRGFSWEERMRPLEGDLEVGGLTFTLHDAPFDGKAALLSHLATRSPQVIVQTRITAATGTATGALAVDDGSSFPTGAQTVWVGREAIRCSGRVGNTFTMVTRGYLSTRALDHRPKAGNVGNPTVWGEFPWVTRRRLILWRVDDANVAWPLWRGYANRAPRLASDGAKFELQAEHLWNVESGLSFAEDGVAVIPGGYNAAAIGFGFDGYRNNFGLGTEHVYRNLSSFLGYLNTPGGPDGNLTDWFADLETRPEFSTTDFESISVAAEGDELVLRARITNYGGFDINDVFSEDGHYDGEITLGWGPSGAGVGTPGVRGVAVHTQDSDVRVGVPVPPAAIVGSGYQAMPIPVDTVGGLPATFATNESYANGPHRTTIRATLRGNLNDDVALELRPSSWTASDVTLDQPMPTITGRLHLVPLTAKGGTVAGVEAAGFFRTGEMAVMFARPTLRYGLAVDGTHWAYALRHVLTSSALTTVGLDPRNWEWSTLDDVADLAGTGSAAEAKWFFDGAAKVREFVTSRAALAGCGVAVRGSRLAFAAFRRPVNGETPAAAFTAADFVATSRPTYTTLPEGIVNVARVTSEDATLNVRYADSIEKYGEARAVELDVPGLQLDALAADYQNLANVVLSRVLFQWSEPAVMVSLPVSIEWATRVFLGDIITAEESILPDGIGGRGLGNAAALAALGTEAQYAFVIGRRIEVRPGGEAILWLDALIQATSFGYAPCIRIVPASTTSTTVTAATAYVRGTGDYTDDPSLSDGGARKFQQDDLVEFVEVGTTTLTTYGPYTVLSVAGPVVTFTGALPGGTVSALSDTARTFEMRFAPYGDGSATTANMRRYAYVGSNTAPFVIGTSAAPARTWSP